MAKAPKPIKRTTTVDKGAPPSITDSPVQAVFDRPDPQKLKDLNFKVSFEFKKAFKQGAMDDDLTQLGYLQKIHNFYQQHKK